MGFAGVMAYGMPAYERDGNRHGAECRMSLPAQTQRAPTGCFVCTVRHGAAVLLTLVQRTL